MDLKAIGPDPEQLRKWAEYGASIFQYPYSSNYPHLYLPQYWGSYGPTGPTGPTGCAGSPTGPTELIKPTEPLAKAETGGASEGPRPTGTSASSSGTSSIPQPAPSAPPEPAGIGTSHTLSSSSSSSSSSTSSSASEESDDDGEDEEEDEDEETPQDPKPEKPQEQAEKEKEKEKVREQPTEVHASCCKVTVTIDAFDTKYDEALGEVHFKVADVADQELCETHQKINTLRALLSSFPGSVAERELKAVVDEIMGKTHLATASVSKSASGGEISLRYAPDFAAAAKKAGSKLVLVERKPSLKALEMENQMLRKMLREKSATEKPHSQEQNQDQLKESPTETKRLPAKHLTLPEVGAKVLVKPSLPGLPLEVATVLGYTLLGRIKVEFGFGRTSEIGAESVVCVLMSGWTFTKERFVTC